MPRSSGSGKQTRMSELPFRRILRDTVRENPSYGSDMVWTQAGPTELQFDLVGSDDLESDSHDDPDYSAYSDKVCPKCGAWDCVDWQDEQISDKELQRLADENSETCSGEVKLRHLPHGKTNH